MFAITLVAALLGPVAVSSHPGTEHDKGGVGVRIDSPAELAGFRIAVQWTGTAPVEDQQAELAYAGTGCTPANYAAANVAGKIALVDDQTGTTPGDVCPVYPYASKVQLAEKAGAIGFVQVSRDDEPTAGSAFTSTIPALELKRTDGLPIRDAVVAGTAVSATLTDTRPTFPRMSNIPCVGGHAGPFDCDGVDLLSFIPAADMNGAGQSDLWGWTDPDTGDEYVLMGKTNGTGIFRVTDPMNPVYLGELPNPGLVHAVWHDMKVYADHAFIVSESEGHGMSVFDLTRLRGVTEAQTWEPDTRYPLIDAAHNIAINEESGYAYIVGGNAGIVAPDQCLSGLHMVDIRDPKSPEFAGCYVQEGGPGTAARSVGDPTVMENSPAAYVHDTQCVIYRGPDTRYTGRELCFNAAEDVVVIVDVTDKLMPKTVGSMSYEGIAYSHQGWLTEDQRHLLLNDELDILEGKVTHSRTVVLDVTDLENPKEHVQYMHDTTSITHNNYVLDDLVYQSNYTTGLRVLDTRTLDDAAPTLKPIAFFDSYPANDDPVFSGTWSNYPYFPSGTIAVSGIDEGLFLLRLNDAAWQRVNGEEQEEVRSFAVTCEGCESGVRAGESTTATLHVQNTGTVQDSYSVAPQGVPEGWTVTADPATVSAGPGQDSHVTLTITVPNNAKAGSYAFTVTVTSQGDPSLSEQVPVTVEVRKGRPTDVGPPT